MKRNFSSLWNMKFLQSKKMFFLLLWWTLMQQFVLSIAQINLQTVQIPSECNYRQFFSVAQLKCQSCTSLQPDAGRTTNGLDSAYFGTSFLHLYATKDQNTTTPESIGSLLSTQDRLSCECKNDFYQPNSEELVCKVCPSSLVSSFDGRSCARCATRPSSEENEKENQTINSNLSCKCAENQVLRERFAETEKDQQVQIEQYCEQCPPGTKPSKNQRDCIPCHRSLGINCTCSESNTVLVDGVCVSLNQLPRTSAGTFRIPGQSMSSGWLQRTLSASYAQCAHYANMTACQQLANLCVLQHYSSFTITLNQPWISNTGSGSTFRSQTSVIASDSGTTVNSAVDTSPPTVCDIYEGLIKRMSPALMTSISWPAGSARSLLLSTPQTIITKPGKVLSLEALITDQSGKFRGQVKVQAQHLLGACGPNALIESFYSKQKEQINYSVNTEHYCSISVSDLFAKTNPLLDSLFYELRVIGKFKTNNPTFGSAKDSTSGLQSLPVFVLNRNLRLDGRLVNGDSLRTDLLGYYFDYANHYADHMSSWKLVRRFFLAEQLTSFTDNQLKNMWNSEENTDIASATFSSKLNQTAAYVRYVKQAELLFRLSNVESDHDQMQLQPPLLILDYEIITLEELQQHPDRIIRSVIKVRFFSEDYSLHLLLKLLLAIGCPLGVFHTLFRAWVWARRANRNSLNIWVLVRLLLLSAHHVSNVFLTAGFLISLHQSIFFKLQKGAHTPTLPDYPLENAVYMYLSIATGLKLLWIISELVERIRAQIFFVDWEPPRGTSVSSGQRDIPPAISSAHTDIAASNGTNFQNGVTTDAIATVSSASSVRLAGDAPLNMDLSTVMNGARPSFDAIIHGSARNDAELQAVPSGPIPLPDVSIWRTYFVANEWMELATYRRVTLFVHLFLFIFFFEILGWKNFCTSDPWLNSEGGNSQSTTMVSFTCRLSLVASLHLIIAATQLMASKIVYERLFRDKIRDFVDLCSVANVSVFALLYSRFGYYIHGRNATGVADVNMAQMQLSLLQEQEEQLGTGRGLLPNSDSQCFQMLLSQPLVQQLSQLRAHLLHPTRQLARKRSLNTAAGLQTPLGPGVISGRMRQCWQAYFTLNQLLSNFLTHLYPEMDYLVRERTTIELLLDAEFAVDAIDDQKTILYVDKCYSFQELMLCGFEIDLLIFELCIFMLVDLGTYDCLLASIITFLVSNTIKRLFYKLAKQNLVEKSLVDERFLL